MRAPAAVQRPDASMKPRWRSNLMNIRFALALTALLPLMVACKAQDGTAETAAPATTPAAAQTAPEAAPAPAATDAAAAPATAEAASTDAAANTPVPAPARPVGPEPVAGTDYVVIEGGQPFQPATGKIEVVEIFGYVCPACARFQPLVGSWKAGLPADVNFVYVPAGFGGVLRRRSPRRAGKDPRPAVRRHSRPEDPEG